MIHQLEKEIAELESLLADLTAQIPAHSTPATLVIRIEEVEERLHAAKARFESERFKG